VASKADFEVQGVFRYPGRNCLSYGFQIFLFSIFAGMQCLGQRDEIQSAHLAGKDARDPGSRACFQSGKTTICC